MKATWTHVAIAWGIIIITVIVIFIREHRKTPEQRKAEDEAAKKRWQRQKEESAKKTQQQANAPAKGCLQDMLGYTILSIILLVCVIVSIMILISTD